MIPLPSPTSFRRFVLAVWGAEVLTWLAWGNSAITYAELGFVVGASAAGEVYSRWFTRTVEGLRDNVNAMAADASATQRGMIERIEALQETLRGIQERRS